MTKKSQKKTRLKYAIQKLKNDHEINMFKLIMEKDSVNFEKKMLCFLITDFNNNNDSNNVINLH